MKRAFIYEGELDPAMLRYLCAKGEHVFRELRKFRVSEGVLLRRRGTPWPRNGVFASPGFAVAVAGGGGRLIIPLRAGDPRCFRQPSHRSSPESSGVTGRRQSVPPSMTPRGAPFPSTSKPPFAPPFS